MLDNQGLKHKRERVKRAIAAKSRKSAIAAKSKKYQTIPFYT